MNKLFALFAGLVICITAVMLYGQSAVYRYPRLSINPMPLPTQQRLPNNVQLSAKGAYIKSTLNKSNVDETLITLRAFTPEVSLRLSSTQNTTIPNNINIENIHPDAKLVHNANSEIITENQQGLFRQLRIATLNKDQPILMRWQFPKKQTYRFVALGDTGGDEELNWGLRRAKELGADFILHLGDIYYHASEVGGVGDRMNQAQIPVYASNGNHDFRGPSGNSVQTYLQNIGPLNTRFTLLGHCFININTGAYMYPAHKGKRGALLSAEVSMQARQPARCTDSIVFTHKPIISQIQVPFPQNDHTLKGADADWILKQIQALNKPSIIAGHIHQDFTFKQDDITTMVTGSGLAHADLHRLKIGTDDDTNADANLGEAAQVLIGDITANQPLKISWALNAMPLSYHCSKKIARKLHNSKAPEDRALADKIKLACAKRLEK